MDSDGTMRYQLGALRRSRSWWCQGVQSKSRRSEARRAPPPFAVLERSPNTIQLQVARPRTGLRATVPEVRSDRGVKATISGPTIQRGGNTHLLVSPARQHQRAAAELRPGGCTSCYARTALAGRYPSSVAFGPWLGSRLSADLASQSQGRYAPPCGPAHPRPLLRPRQRWCV